MTTEVATDSGPIGYAPTTKLITVNPHQRFSLYANAPAGAASAPGIGSIWTVYGFGASGAGGILAIAKLTQQGTPQLLLQNLEAEGLTLAVIVTSPGGAATGIQGVLVGFDPATAMVPASAGATKTLAVNVETDVVTLAGGFSVLNALVDGSGDARTAGTIFRLYATAGGIRTLLRQSTLQANITSNGPGGQITVGAPLPQDIFAQQTASGDVMSGSDGYVLTAQNPNTVCTFLASLTGSSAGGPTVPSATLAGDTVGPANANTVQSLSGGYGANAGLINVGGYFGFSPFANLPNAGDFRYSALVTNARNIIESKEGVTNVPILYTDGVGGLYFGDGSSLRFGLVAIVGATNVTLNVAGSQWAQLTGGVLRSYGNAQLSIQNQVGAFTTTSDANLTGYDWNLNGGASLLGVRPNWNLGQTAAGASVSFDGTNINLKVGAANVAHLNANQFIFDKGVNLGTPLQVGGPVTLTSTTLLVVGTVSAVVTLPANPAAGDSVSFFSRVGALTVNGNGKNVLLSGTSAASQLVASGTAARVVYDAASTLWLMSAGF